MAEFEIDPLGIPEGSIGRLLHDMTVGTHARIRGKDTLDSRHKLKEIELQFQFLISGTAAKSLTFEEVEIPFDYAFYFAPGQRESSLQYPHFTYGSQSNPPVGVHCTVTEWAHDESVGTVTGARVAVGVHGAGAFTGVVHMTFQGFGRLIEETEEEGE